MKNKGDPQKEPWGVTSFHYIHGGEEEIAWETENQWLVG